MKLPSSWDANAAVCALAFIKHVAVRQSLAVLRLHLHRFLPSRQKALGRLETTCRSYGSDPGRGGGVGRGLGVALGLGVGVAVGDATTKPITACWAELNTQF
jgi:hypothetical protein